MPKGLGYQGQKLWKSIVEEFDIEAEPHKLRLLYDAAKVADTIATLEKGTAGEPLTVRGSAQQRVIHPLISEVRFQRGLLSQLLARLNFEGPIDD